MILKIELITDYKLNNRTLSFKAIDEHDNVYLVKGTNYQLETLKDLKVSKGDSIVVRANKNAWGELLLSKVLCRGDD